MEASERSSGCCVRSHKAGCGPVRSREVNGFKIYFVVQTYSAPALSKTDACRAEKKPLNLLCTRFPDKNSSRSFLGLTQKVAASLLTQIRF